jgi:ARG and Rhodanese-Phosphatase-superfamily-associated Protein domain
MSRHAWFASLICCSLAGCNRAPPTPVSRTTSPATTTAAATATDDLLANANLTVAAPIRHGNLTIFPVVSRIPRTDDRFITLAEGLKGGTVEILEMGARPGATSSARGPNQSADNREEQIGQTAAADGDEPTAAEGDDLVEGGNDVNRLVVVNRSGRPLYLMPGELIVGGSQDRSIAEEMVIESNGKPVPVNVYCVEPGRWGTRDAETAAAVLSDVLINEGTETDSPASLAVKADQGQFVLYPGVLSKSTRLAVQEGAGQSKVWDEVAKANGASGVTWSSGAFTANYVDKEVLARLQPYLDALNDPVASQAQVVGVIVAVNGKIENVDVFESTPLFRKLWPQLLKSFALTALESADSEEKCQPGTRTEAETFLASTLKDQAEASKKTEGGLVVSHHDASDHVSFSAGMMGGMGGGFGGAIHSSGYSK